MAQDILTAKVNDLLLNYVQAYVNWLAHSESPAAFQDNQQMVVIQAELNRRDRLLREAIANELAVFKRNNDLELENVGLRLQIKKFQKQLSDCMEQLDPYGDQNAKKP